ncbi:MAG: hypothetical protein IJT65_06525 [Eubacterium sp.]|nr:hypothetical protein [Eubacterium sp.]
MPGAGNSKAFAITSFLASASMLLEFIRQVSRLAKAITEPSNNSTAFFVLLVLISLFSLGACFYFAFFTFSFGKTSYDLKQLGALHFLPILWAGARVVYLIYEGESPVGNRQLALKYALLSVMLIYFYFYVSRILDVKKSERINEICSFILTGISLMYFIQSVIFIAEGKCELLDSNVILAASSLLICPFALVFKRDYISEKENGE